MKIVTKSEMIVGIGTHSIQRISYKALRSNYLTLAQGIAKIKFSPSSKHSKGSGRELMTVMFLSSATLANVFIFGNEVGSLEERQEANNAGFYY